MSTPTPPPRRDPHEQQPNKPSFSDRQCGHDPDAPVFVNGTAMGLRKFRVSKDGWLRGITYPQTWLPGENVARCFVTLSRPDATSQQERERIVKQYEVVVAGWGFKEDPSASPDLLGWWADGGCVGLAPSCACGFYAYHDGKQHHYSGAHNASAIIEGYGRVVLGPYGFRAQKARVIAVVPPYAESQKVIAEWRAKADELDQTIRDMIKGRRWRLSSMTKYPLLASIAAGIVSVDSPFGALAVGICAALSVAIELFARKQFAIALRAVASLKSAYTQKFIEANAQGASPAALAATVAKMRKNYPGVRFYDSTAEMLAAHPVENLGHLVGEPSSVVPPSPGSSPFWPPMTGSAT